tara:strand:- start:253 stop:846 length:594 start_codon:yes stop_codon:yes gene_type:complete
VRKDQKAAGLIVILVAKIKRQERKHAVHAVAQPERKEQNIPHVVQHQLRVANEANTAKNQKPVKKDNIMKITKQTLRQLVKEELSNLLDEEYYHISDATYDDGTIVEDLEFWDDVLEEAEYQGRKVTLNKPMKGDVKKSKVYVKDPKTGNVKKVNFGDKKMKIKKSNPKRRKSFRARHNCDNPGPKTKARYWSCKAW